MSVHAEQMTTLEKKIGHFSRILSSRPGDELTILALAEASFRRGLKLEALTAYQEVVGGRPVPEAHLAVAEIYSAQGMPNEAYGELRRLFELDPQNVEARLLVNVLQGEALPPEDVRVTMESPTTEEAFDEARLRLKIQRAIYNRELQERTRNVTLEPGTVLHEYHMEEAKKKLIRVDELLRELERFREYNHTLSQLPRPEPISAQEFNTVGEAPEGAPTLDELPSELVEPGANPEHEPTLVAEPQSDPMVAASPELDRVTPEAYAASTEPEAVQGVAEPTLDLDSTVSQQADATEPEAIAVELTPEPMGVAAESAEPTPATGASEPEAVDEPSPTSAEVHFEPTPVASAPESSPVLTFDLSPATVAPEPVAPEPVAVEPPLESAAEPEVEPPLPTPELVAAESDRFPAVDPADLPTQRLELPDDGGLDDLSIPSAEREPAPRLDMGPLPIAAIDPHVPSSFASDFGLSMDSPVDPDLPDLGSDLPGEDELAPTVAEAVDAAPVAEEPPSTGPSAADEAAEESSADTMVAPPEDMAPPTFNDAPTVPEPTAATTSFSAMPMVDDDSTMILTAPEPELPAAPQVEAPSPEPPVFSSAEVEAPVGLSAARKAFYETHAEGLSSLTTTLARTRGVTSIFLVAREGVTIDAVAKDDITEKRVGDLVKESFEFLEAFAKDPAYWVLECAGGIFVMQKLDDRHVLIAIGQAGANFGALRYTMDKTRTKFEQLLAQAPQ